MRCLAFIEVEIKITNIIDLKNISYKYHGSNGLALKNISFGIRQGEILGVVGPNGGGKSTLLSIVEGINRKYTGEITSSVKSIGSVFQTNGYFDNLTVKENIKTFSSMYKHHLSYQELGKLIDLSEIENKKLGDLSGGQKQRVYLAFGILNDPDILFLDEPTTGLDPKNRMNLWKIIKCLTGTVVITSHYMDEVSFLCDRVCFINEGKLFAIGTPDELIEKSKVNGNLKFTCVDKQLIEELKQEYECRTIDQDRFQISVINANKLAETLISKYGKKLVDIKVENPTLNDAYYQITGFNLGVMAK